MLYAYWDQRILNLQDIDNAVYHLYNVNMSVEKLLNIYFSRLFLY